MDDHTTFSVSIISDGMTLNATTREVGILGLGFELGSLVLSAKYLLNYELTMEAAIFLREILEAELVRHPEKKIRLKGIKLRKLAREYIKDVEDWQDEQARKAARAEAGGGSGDDQ